MGDKIYKAYKPSLRMNNRGLAWLIPVIIIVLGLVFLGFVVSDGFINKLDIVNGENYVQAPTFYYYECAPATNPVESKHVALTTGSSNGYITCPSNSEQCDLWVSQTEKTAWYSLSRRLVYQICHSSGQCDPKVYVSGDHWYIPYSKATPSVHIPNLIQGDKVSINYQSQNLLMQWSDKPNGAEWYQTYKPFILWKTDMTNEGRTEYTTQEEGCNFPSGSVSGLINSVVNSIKPIKEQSSTSNTNLGFYKTRNFIGTYIPISTANVNFVTYNGQNGYCLNRQVFAITTVNTNGGTYKIVDQNFNTRLATSVACCPNENEPTRTCNNNFQWVDKTQPNEGQCSLFKACEGADWAPNPTAGKSLIRYNCINTRCVAETKSVSCTVNTDCGSGQSCDTKLWKCVDVKPGDVISNLTCKDGKTLITSYDYNFWSLIGVQKPTTRQECKYITFWDKYGLYLVLIVGLAFMVYCIFFIKKLAYAVAIGLILLLYLSYHYLGLNVTILLAVLAIVLFIIYTFRTVIMRLVI